MLLDPRITLVCGCLSYVCGCVCTGVFRLLARLRSSDLLRIHGTLSAAGKEVFRRLRDQYLQYHEYKGDI